MDYTALLLYVFVARCLCACRLPVNLHNRQNFFACHNIQSSVVVHWWRAVSTLDALALFMLLVARCLCVGYYAVVLLRRCCLWFGGSQLVRWWLCIVVALSLSNLVGLYWCLSLAAALTHIHLHWFWLLVYEELYFLEGDKTKQTISGKSNIDSLVIHLIRRKQKNYCYIHSGV